MDQQADNADDDRDMAGLSAGLAGSDAVFRANLQAFGGRAARLGDLLRRRRISSDRCFLALTQLWIQLARSYRDMDDHRPESGPVEPGDR